MCTNCTMDWEKQGWKANKNPENRVNADDLPQSHSLDENAANDVRQMSLVEGFFYQKMKLLIF